MAAKNNKPIKQFRAGTISASVWENENSVNGKMQTFRSVQLQKRYMDDKKEWQTSNSINMNELPKAILVLQKAYEFITLKQDDSDNSDE